MKLRWMGLVVLAVGCMGQTLPGVPGAVAPAAGPVALSPEARELLTVLHDRKDTLKDFTGKIDYSVADGRTGDATGKRGDIAFIMDAIKGPTFSAVFAIDTVDGKARKSNHVEFIFDGRDFTLKNFGIDGKTREFARNTLLPPGAKPGDAVTLSGAMPIPIGLDVEDVARTFEVTMLPSKDAAQSVMKLVPRDVNRFNYASLVVTVDTKLQLPVKLVQTASGDERRADVTTIVLTGLEINAGKAKLADATTPAADGWRPLGGGAPAVP